MAKDANDANEHNNKPHSTAGAVLAAPPGAGLGLVQKPGCLCSHPAPPLAHAMEPRWQHGRSESVRKPHTQCGLTSQQDWPPTAKKSDESSRSSRRTPSGPRGQCRCTETRPNWAVSRIASNQNSSVSGASRDSSARLLLASSATCRTAVSSTVEFKAE
eukprot:4765362-Prymnesium_polylepis.2